MKFPTKSDEIGQFFCEFVPNLTFFPATYQKPCLCLFVCPLDWIMLILMWFERSLPPAQFTDKVVLDRWPHMGYMGCGGYGRFRSEWVRLLVKEWAFTVIIINSTHRSWTSWQYDVSFSSSRTAAKSCSDTATWKGKKETIVNIYYSAVNNYDVVKYNLSYVKCETVLVSDLPICRRAEW